MIDERKGDKWLGVVNVNHKAKQRKGKEPGNEHEARVHLCFTIVFASSVCFCLMLSTGLEPAAPACAGGYEMWGEGVKHTQTWANTSPVQSSKYI